MERPSLKDLTERITSDIVSRLNDDNPLPVNDALVYAKVFAGVAHGMYGYSEWLWRQMFAHTADADYLETHANFWLEEARHQASKAVGSATFTGAGTIKKGSILRSAQGIEYATDAEIISPASVNITALIGGKDGNMSAGNLNLTSPVAGVNNQASTSGLTGGEDEEGVEDFRVRVLAKQAARPIYGKKGDYTIWASEVEGVTRAWEVKGNSNLVQIYIVSDASNPITPNATLLAKVQNHINDVRPVCADAQVLAPVLVPINFNITLTPNNTAVRDAVYNALQDLIRREANIGGTIYRTHIAEAISTVNGEINHVLNAPTADVVVGAGQLATTGTYTWS